MTTYKQALTRLDNFSNFEKKAHLLKPVFSLQGISDILSRLGAPHDKFPCVHVAGTVGKGSVCFMTEAALRAAGFKTGLYISPHIRDIRERIRVNDKMISQKNFARMYDAVLDKGRARPDEHTYFEVLTAMAFHYFAESKVDIAIIETGLGGRLDSTNVVPGFLSVITRIGHDHKAVLGNTLREIAGEKAGIIKPDAHLVALKQSPDVNRVLQQECREHKTTLVWAAPAPGDGFLHRHIPDVFRTNAFYSENLTIVRAVLDTLACLNFPVGEGHLVRALQGVSFPARMQWHTLKRRKKTVRVLIDAGHNAPAARALRAELEKEPHTGVCAVVGMMRDKDANAFLNILAPGCDSFICATLDAPRAWPATELAQRAEKHCASVQTAKDVEAAMDAALKQSRNNGIIVFTGTFYAINRALDWVEKG